MSGSIQKNGLMTFSAQILNFAVAFISSIILARMLGPTGVGLYALVVLIPGTLVLFGTLGIEAATVYFIGSKRHDTLIIIGNSLSTAIFLGIFLMGLFWGIFHLAPVQQFVHERGVNLSYIWLVVFTVPLSLLLSFFSCVLLGKEEIGQYNKVSVTQNLFQFIAVIILVVLFHQGLSGALRAYVVGVISATVLVIMLVRTLGKINFSFNPKLFKDSLRYGLKAYVGNMTQFLNYRLDVYLVAFFLTPAAVGFYGIAYGIAERLWIIPGAIATILFPRISSLENSFERNQLTSRLARHTFLMVLILSLLLGLLARLLIGLFFGSAFLPSVLPLLILLPGVVALGGAKTLTADLAGRGRPEIGTVAALISLVANVFLNFFLIPRWGISGAAFSSTVSYIINTVVVMIGFTLITKVPWLEVLVLKKSDIQDYVQLFKKIKPLLLGYRNKISSLCGWSF